MQVKIHNDIKKYEDFLNEGRNEKISLQDWNKYDIILMSNDSFFVMFAKTSNDYWELHCDFKKEFRGIKSLKVLKECISWMFKHKTPTVICGIPQQRKDIRLMANAVGFKKYDKNNNLEFYKMEA